MRGGLAVLALVATCIAAAAAAGDKERLVGVWRGETTFMGYPAVTESVMQANGTFSTLVKAPGYMGRHWGQWTLPQGGILRLVYDGHEPKQFCGPLGCQAIHQVDAETVSFQFVDDNRLVTRPSVCMLPPCEMMLVRAR